ncbi:hypothetical protein [Halomarina pelagica]|uniref:hypothetical protein n=1 Tax=Halomarina pelagica TaxID=2961599 RepID=UPI0020C360A2|nr:hypothetical protein [Halomarina sp. BND7]
MAITRDTETETGTDTDTDTGGELCDPTTLPPQRACERCGCDRFYVYGRDGERPRFVCPACGVRLDGDAHTADSGESTESSDRTLLADVASALPLASLPRGRHD